MPKTNPDNYARNMTRSEYDAMRWKQNGKRYALTHAENLITRNGGVVTWPNGKPQTNEETR